MSITAINTTSGRHRMSEAEWQTRVELAACYRLADMNHMSKVIWNHITARVPGEEGHILINELGLRYDEVTASNLLKIDFEGNIIDGNPKGLNRSGWVIHGAIHQARHDVACVMHTHSRGGQGVSALRCGLLPLCQEALMFFEEVSYHGYEGLASGVDERVRLVADLGANDQLIMRNHGLLTVGRSIGEAFWRMYHMERACALQMDVLACGQEYELPPREACVKAREQYRDGKPGGPEWPALLRLVDKVCPDYKT
jgi:ribulose-5-phosphate 4-epimerase/fuculose-1-phosphate aldolase